MLCYFIIFITFTCVLITRPIYCLFPPKFQWKYIDYAWESWETREEAIRTGNYIPDNNLPVGIARWNDKLFITIPRWKRGVPSSLNWIRLDMEADQPFLMPYPSWADNYVSDESICVPSNATVVSAFRIHVDECNRLWVVDTGTADIYGNPNQVTDPSIVIFELENDTLFHRHILSNEAIKGPETFFTSIVVDVINGECSNAFAYITDMGANAIAVYSLADDESWRVDHPYFHFDPHAGIYSVGGVDFYWSDGVSSAALSNPDKDGLRDLYFSPVSSIRQFKISTSYLRDRGIPQDEFFDGVITVGTRPAKTQSIACDMDVTREVLFFTQIARNGLACWNINKNYTAQNTPMIFSDCILMEFPSDVIVDADNNLWLLSNKMPKFLYAYLDKTEYNYKVLTGPVDKIIQGTTCAVKKLKKKSSREEKKVQTVT